MTGSDDEGVELHFDDVDADVGVPDGEGTTPDEATAPPGYHFEKALEHAEKAFADVEDGATLDVFEDLTLDVDGDRVVLRDRPTGVPRYELDRSDALLLAKCLEVTTSVSTSTSGPAAEVYHGP